MFGTPANNIHRFPKGTIRDLVDSVNYGTSAKASIDSGEYPILRMGNITYQGRWDFTDLKYIDLSVKERINIWLKKAIFFSIVLTVRNLLVKQLCMKKTGLWHLLDI